MSIKQKNNFKYYRLKRNLTQQQVLPMLEQASASRLSVWENGEATPSIDNLIKLSELYRIPIEKLVGGFARKQSKRKKITDTEPAPLHDSQYRQYFGKEYESMTEEDLLNALAGLMVEAYLESNRTLL